MNVLRGEVEWTISRLFRLFHNYGHRLAHFDSLGWNGRGGVHYAMALENRTRNETHRSLRAAARCYWHLHGDKPSPISLARATRRQAKCFAARLTGISQGNLSCIARECIPKHGHWWHWTQTYRSLFPRRKMRGVRSVIPDTSTRS